MRKLLLFIAFLCPNFFLPSPQAMAVSVLRGKEFIKNLGQWNGEFRYKDSPPKTASAATGVPIKAGIHAECSTRSESGPFAYNNYFPGNDPSRWKTSIHPSLFVGYGGYHNGIDMDVYSYGNSLKYDFKIASSAATGSSTPSRTIYLDSVKDETQHTYSLQSVVLMLIITALLVYYVPKVIRSIRGKINKAWSFDDIFSLALCIFISIGVIAGEYFHSSITIVFCPIAYYAFVIFNGFKGYPENTKMRNWYYVLTILQLGDHCINGAANDVYTSMRYFVAFIVIEKILIGTIEFRRKSKRDISIIDEKDLLPTADEVQIMQS